MEKAKIVLLGFVFSLIVFLLCIKSAFFEVENEKQRQVIDFLFGKDDHGLNFSKSEIEHLIEVKGFVFIGRILLFCLLASFLGFLIVGIANRKEQLFLYGGIFGAVILLFGFVAMLGFDQSFELMHRLFFKTQWRFSEDSLLIKTFPYEFFIERAKMILFRFSVFVISCFAISFLLRRVSAVHRKACYFLKRLS
ncbi:hypothetical protein DRZ77_01730 [Candidatus Woesearchaeota archaeon]|nr:MAG: hypothetical protein DRZ77_01730 [Candidatus Woesearchaeota archaeon]